MKTDLHFLVILFFRNPKCLRQLHCISQQFLYLHFSLNLIKLASQQISFLKQLVYLSSFDLKTLKSMAYLLHRSFYASDVLTSHEEEPFFIKLYLASFIFLLQIILHHLLGFLPIHLHLKLTLHLLRLRYYLHLLHRQKHFRILFQHPFHFRRHLLLRHQFLNLNPCTHHHRLVNHYLLKSYHQLISFRSLCHLLSFLQQYPIQFLSQILLILTRLLPLLLLNLSLLYFHLPFPNLLHLIPAFDFLHILCM